MKRNIETDIIISDAAPLIFLMKADSLFLLGKLYDKVYIPRKVYHELTGNPDFPIEINKINEATKSFLKVKDVMDEESVHEIQVSNRIHRGESEAIVLAIQSNIQELLIEDDDGIKAAKNNSLDVLDTVCIFKQAYKKRIIDDDYLNQVINKAEKRPNLYPKDFSVCLNEIINSRGFVNEDINKMKEGDNVEFCGRVVKMSSYTVKTGGIDEKGYSVNLSVDGKGTVNIKTENPAQVELIEKKFRIGRLVKVQGEVKQHPLWIRKSIKKLNAGMSVRTPVR